jgi:glycine C-acetyltransferase
MPLVIGNLKRLELLRTQPSLREQLWTNVNKLQTGLKNRGFDIGITNSPVTPVFLQCSIEQAGQLIIDLRENFNIFCSAVLYPVIPKGQLMLRIIPTAAHTDADIHDTLEAFTAVNNKLKNNEYNNPQLAAMFDTMLAS